MDIGVVGRLRLQVAVQDAAQREVLQRILDRRIGLQGDAAAQAVDVDPGDAGHLVRLARLLVDDRREGHHLQAAQPAALALGVPHGGPETVVLLLHAPHELLGCRRPPQFVGIGYEHRKERHAVEAQLAGHTLRSHHAQQRRRIGIELPREFPGQLRGRAHVVDRHPHGGLQPQLEHAGHLDDAHAGLEEIMARLEGLGQIDPPGIAVEGGTVPHAGHERINHLLIGGVRADEELRLFGHGASLELHEARNAQHEHNRHGRQQQPNPCFFTHCGNFFCKDTKFSYFCTPGESYTTSSHRIPQARNRARVCGRSGAI